MKYVSLVQILQALPTIVARIASDGARLNAKCSFLIWRHVGVVGDGAVGAGRKQVN